MAMHGTSSESDRVLSWAEDVPAAVDLTQSEQDEWTRRVDDVPAEIAGREAAELEAYDGVTADSMRAVARGLTGG